MESKLEEIFKEITCLDKDGVCAKVLSEAISSMNGNRKNFYETCEKYAEKREKDKEQAFQDACWQFVRYQLDTLYGRSVNKFNEEGFMIGSPWHGDVEKAPILFLGSNPGVTSGCVFPRWHLDNESFSLLGRSEAAKNNLEVPSLLHEKYEAEGFLLRFFTKRFQEPWATRVTSGGYVNALLLKDKAGEPQLAGKGCGVPYWRRMHDLMEQLLIGPKGEYQKDINEYEKHLDWARTILIPVLSAEIIPFGSQKEIGAKDERVLNYCWEKYTQPLLKNCRARILVLVGDIARDTFGRSLGLKNGTVKSGKTFSYDVVSQEGYERYRNAQGEYVVLAVNHFSAREKDQNYKCAICELMENSEPEVKEVLDQTLGEAWNLIKEAEKSKDEAIARSE